MSTELVPLSSSNLTKIETDKQKTEAMLAQLQALQIQTDEVQANIEEVFAFAKRCAKDVNAQRMAWQKPYSDEVTRIQKAVKPLEDSYERIATICKQKLSAYYAKREAERQALLRAAEAAIDEQKPAEATEALMQASVVGQVHSEAATIRKTKELYVTNWATVFKFLQEQYTVQMRPMPEPLLRALLTEIKAIAKDVAVPGTEMREVMSPTLKR